MSSVPSTSTPQQLLEVPLSLDERIQRAELHLIAREDRLRRRIDSLGRRLHEATQPRRLTAWAVGGVVGLGALWMLWRGAARPLASRSAASALGRAAAGFSHGAASDLSWVRMLALAWPVLPAAWRARISPGTAATLVSVGLPLAERLLAPARHPPLPTAAHVDLARYAGTWHEIARLGAPFEARCADQPSAHYTLRADHIEILNRCVGRNGRARSSRGVARVVPDSGNAKLQVTMLPSWLQWLPFAWADHWVLYIDEAYGSALVGHPNRRQLWVLSRARRMPAAHLSALMRFASELQFPVERLQIVQPD